MHKYLNKIRRYFLLLAITVILVYVGFMGMLFGDPLDTCRQLATISHKNSLTVTEHATMQAIAQLIALYPMIHPDKGTMPLC